MARDDDLDSSGLLDGLDGEARRERAELVTWLLERGFGVEQIRASFTPILLASNRVIGDDGTRVSLQELSDSTGVSIEVLQQLHRAVGLARVDDPSLAVHPRADAESVLHAVELLDMGFDPEQIVLVLRLLVDGLTHAAVVMRQTALQHLLRPGTTEVQLAQAAEVLSRQTEPLIGPLVVDLLRLTLRHGFQTEVVDAAELEAGTLPDTREIAVAFADLVGFTRLGEALPPEDLARLAGGLGDRARDVAQDPVQFVKPIGDAVMLISAEPPALLNAVLDLVDVVESDALPRLRAGIAYGLAASYGGDWYGSPVNVASRITAVAPPWAVYVEESARAVIGDAPGIAWHYVGPRRLKGVRDDVRFFQASRAKSPRDEAVEQRAQ